MTRVRRAAPALRGLVRELWASDGVATDRAGAGAERVLPTGLVHVVLRLGDEPLRTFESSRAIGARVHALAVVGGPRCEPYFRDVSRPVASVGAVLAPGATLALLGAPARELAGVHVPLEALWGGEVAGLRDELASAASLDERIACLERALAARARRSRAPGLHRGVAFGLATLSSLGPVDAAARASGLSHRRFGELVREAVGFAPKRWMRLGRFQRVLHAAAARPDRPWASLASELGYSDQSHLVREFRALAGISPGEYRRARPSSPNHVPLAPLPLPISTRQPSSPRACSNPPEEEAR